MEYEKKKLVAELVDGKFSVHDNPFYEQHVQAEIDYTPVRTRAAIKHARAIVTEEFVRSGHDRPRRCPCGELMWYRATTMTFSCRKGHKAVGNGELFTSSQEELESQE